MLLGFAVWYHKELPKLDNPVPIFGAVASGAATVVVSLFALTTSVERPGRITTVLLYANVGISFSLVFYSFSFVISFCWECVWVGGTMLVDCSFSDFLYEGYVRNWCCWLSQCPFTHQFFLYRQVLLFLPLASLATILFSIMNAYSAEPARISDRRTNTLLSALIGLTSQLVTVSLSSVVMCVRDEGTVFLFV